MRTSRSPPTSERADVQRRRSSEAARFLKAAGWRLETALDSFYNDPGAVRAADQHREQSKGGGASVVKNLEKLWERYRGELRSCASAGGREDRELTWRTMRRPDEP